MVVISECECVFLCTITLPVGRAHICRRELLAGVLDEYSCKRRESPRFCYDRRDFSATHIRYTVQTPDSAFYVFVLNT